MELAGKKVMVLGLARTGTATVRFLSRRGADVLASDVRTEDELSPALEGLRGLDDVAYVRFASVYRNFREAKDFEAFVGELSGEPLAEQDET